jgi:hypothetical protein
MMMSNGRKGRGCERSVSPKESDVMVTIEMRLLTIEISFEDEWEEERVLLF